MPSLNILLFCLIANIKIMLKDIVFLKNCPCCQKKKIYSLKKKKKNYRIFGIDGSDIISRFKCSNCLELIIYVDNENRKKFTLGEIRRRSL